MIAARIWTDGSCAFGAGNGSKVRPGPRGWGGWAAVIERGGFEVVRRGREVNTTAMEMEIRAIVEGLRTLPPAVEAVVFSDITGTVVMHEKWRRWRFEDGEFDQRLGKGMWGMLVEQLERVDVRFELLLGKDKLRPEHRRCHNMAGQEAKSAVAALPFPHTVAVPVPVPRPKLTPSRKLGERRTLRGPPPPSKGWHELAELARSLQEQAATLDPDSHW